MALLAGWCSYYFLLCERKNENWEMRAQQGNVLCMKIRVNQRLTEFRNPTFLNLKNGLLACYHLFARIVSIGNVCYNFCVVFFFFFLLQAW